jgi:hypothetical protein
VFPLGEIAIYPLTPRVPPHKEKEWSTTWFGDALRDIRGDRHTRHPLQIANDAYWHSDYESVCAKDTPVKDIMDLYSLSERRPWSVTCNAHVAGEVHRNILRSSNYPGSMRAVRKEEGTTSNYDDPDPWDIARVFRMQGTAYIPSVLDVARMVEEAEDNFLAIMLALPKQLPQAAEMAIACYATPPLPTPSGASPLITPGTERRLTSSVADVTKYAFELIKIYASCVEKINFTGEPVTLGNWEGSINPYFVFAEW